MAAFEDDYDVEEEYIEDEPLEGFTVYDSAEDYGMQEYSEDEDWEREFAADLADMFARQSEDDYGFD